MEKPDNYAAFYGLLNRMRTSDREALKRTIVNEFTSGRTESLREMTAQEYDDALKGMRKLVIPTYKEQMEKVMRSKRSAVLHQLQLIGVDTSDWGKVNAYCRDKRIAGKEFRALDGDELDALLVKLRAIRRKQENNV
jgi:hypothetical protein